MRNVSRWTALNGIARSVCECSSPPTRPVRRVGSSLSHRVVARQMPLRDLSLSHTARRVDKHRGTNASRVVALPEASICLLTLAWLWVKLDNYRNPQYVICNRPLEHTDGC